MNLDELFNAAPHQPRHCQFAGWLSTLSEEDRHSVWRAFDNENIRTRHIYQVVKSIGYPNGESSLRTHRRGECKQCERERNDITT